VPSPHESLSLLALEAFAVGTPVLANGRSEVLVDHCRRSNAGLYYEDRWEFIEALKLLTRDAGMRAAMGRNGQAYVNANYRWDIIMHKYERMMMRLKSPSPVRSHEPERERHRRPPQRPAQRDRRPHSQHRDRRPRR